MEHNWAEARKSAEKIENFLGRLTAARAVFDAAAAAEAHLAHLLPAVAEAEERVASAVTRANAAEANSKKHVKEAEDTARMAQAGARDKQQEVAHTCRALEEEMERDRLAFVAFKVRLARERKQAEVECQARLSQLAQAEENARASLARIEERRQQMIRDLSDEKETSDATPA